MHIEKNVFDNILNTMMEIKGKTKDNLNAQKDLKIICNGPELEVEERRPTVMPKILYILTKEQKRRIYEWITHLKFSNGYASNLTCCVNMKELRLHGMKSHDCHVFMQKLILIAFHEMLPESVWSALSCRNDDLSMNDTHIQQSIFNYPGRASGASKNSCLSGSGCHIIDTYILTNCEAFTLYYESFLNELYVKYHPKDPIIEELVNTLFKD
ncbi:UNVERIFIED_CONTAM: hypothetical protein Sradi_0207800 [Sesamum radiatum]|uniref:Uncharacterized protein n=1 Tax=Sesamum radiatum TaxID=300843 RepID=A0AAW2W192_SESRA